MSTKPGWMNGGADGPNKPNRPIEVEQPSEPMSALATFGFNMSTEAGRIATALLKTQEAIHKGSAASWLYFLSVLREHGIVLVQTPSRLVGEFVDHEIDLTTLLIHSSGQWISCDMTAGASCDLAHLRSQSLAMLLGIMPTEAGAKEIPVKRDKRDETKSKVKLFAYWQEKLRKVRSQGELDRIEKDIKASGADPSLKLEITTEIVRAVRRIAGEDSH